MICGQRPRIATSLEFLMCRSISESCNTFPPHIGYWWWQNVSPAMQDIKSAAWRNKAAVSGAELEHTGPDQFGVRRIAHGTIALEP